jgi:hypothetical protein
MVDFVEDIVETDVKPEDVAHIIETDLEKEKKTRNSPSKKIQTIEHRTELIEEEMKNLRHYIRRLEDAFILKFGKKDLPESPPSVIEDNKRIFKDLELEPEPVETTEEVAPVIEKKKRKLRRDQAVAIPAPETGKKKRGRPKGSKNKSK